MRIFFARIIKNERAGTSQNQGHKDCADGVILTYDEKNKRITVFTKNMYKKNEQSREKAQKEGEKKNNPREDVHIAKKG